MIVWSAIVKKNLIEVRSLEAVAMSKSIDLPAEYEMQYWILPRRIGFFFFNLFDFPPLSLTLALCSPSFFFKFHSPHTHTQLTQVCCVFVGVVVLLFYPSHGHYCVCVGCDCLFGIFGRCVLYGVRWCTPLPKVIIINPSGECCEECVCACNCPWVCNFFFKCWFFIFDLKKKKKRTEREARLKNELFATKPDSCVLQLRGHDQIWTI